MKAAERQHLAVEDRLARGLCAACTRPRLPASARFCEFHLEYYLERSKSRRSSP